MIIKSRIRAFTLNELVIVMVISAIVMGIAFTVLSMVKRHMWYIEANFNKNTEINKLEQALWIDTNTYGSLLYNENELRFKNPLDSITYRFTEDHITRAKDTFGIKAEKLSLFFDGNEIDFGKVDAIKLEFSKDFGNQQLFIYKQNDASQYMD